MSKKNFVFLCVLLVVYRIGQGDHKRRYKLIDWPDERREDFCL